MIGYHFTTDKLRDGRPVPPVGEWLEHDGPVVPCKSGLHASEHPADALQYAPGNLMHLVEVEGDIKTHGDHVDKVAGRRRKIIATIDAEPILRAYARWCALQVVDLWKCPEIVLTYLETGREDIRAAARAAAESAARDASAAWDAVAAASGAAREVQRANLKEMVDEAFAAVMP